MDALDNPILDIQAGWEARRAADMQLVESWSKRPGKDIRARDEMIDCLKGIEDDDKKAMLARLYENTMRYIRRLKEATNSVNVGSFEKFVFPIIRSYMANLVAAELVTVQALDAPTGLIFFFEPVYGTTKGRIQRGTKMSDVRRGPSTEYTYTGERVKDEPMGTGTGAATNFTGNLAQIPVRGTTVAIGDGTRRAVDDGNGGLIGNVDALGNNTIDYASGAYDVTFATAPDAGAAIVANYEFNSEGQANTPEIDLQMTTASLTARKWALRCRYSIEAAQDFESYHGLKLEMEAVSFMRNEIAKEVNYEIVRHLRTIAASGLVTWDRTPPAGVPWIWHKESLVDALVQGQISVHERTQRVTPNWVVGGPGFCEILETLNRFKAIGGGSNEAGIRKVGTINDMTVYRDPSFGNDGGETARNEFLMGYKGSGFNDCGYIWAPYLPLYITNTVVLDDLLARKGMAYRAARKPVNANMYIRGIVTQTGGAYVP